MVYELAKDTRTAERFAGYLPQVGAPHPGFTQFADGASTPAKNFMGFWGTKDTTVPGVANFPPSAPEVALDTAFSGWLYIPADDIAATWAEANGNLDSSTPYDASAYSSNLQCVGWIGPDLDSNGEPAEVVRCFFEGGHSCPGFGLMPDMMWDFALSHPNTTVPPATCQ